MLQNLLVWDAEVARAVAGLAGWWPLDAVMAAASAVGVWGAVWIALGLGLALRHRGFVAHGYVRLLWALLLTSTLVNGVIKPVVARPRPDGRVAASSLVAAVTSRTQGYSFPSGHAASAAAGAVGLGCMLRRRRAWVWALALLIAASRVYLGVHYVSDVVVGLVVGWAVAVFATARTPCYISGSANAVLPVPR